MPTDRRSPADVIRQALMMSLSDEDGEEVTLTLYPPLTESELETFQAGLPCPLPADVVELLQLCRGFANVGAEFIDFTGHELSFEQSDVFPFGVPIATDGFGNHWVVDLTPNSLEYGPVYFACHDAPVILFQSDNLADFLVELFRMCTPPYTSLVDDVHEDRIKQIWVRNPNVLEFSAAIESQDELIAGFAATLDEAWQFIDLRQAQPGDGFSWGRYGPRTEIRRCGYEPLFAYEKKLGLLRRIWGALK